VARRADHARRYRARFRVHAGFLVTSAVFAAAFVALTLSAFHSPVPHGIPVGITAPAAVTGQVEDTLASRAPGRFDLRVYPSEAGARAGIARRQVDGALIADGGHRRLLVAQAGGNGPAQALTQVFTAMAVSSGRPLAVTDVVPPLPGDSDALSTPSSSSWACCSRAWRPGPRRRWCSGARGQPGAWPHPRPQPP
jgi:hypothetical protein